MADIDFDILLFFVGELLILIVTASDKFIMVMIKIVVKKQSMAKV
jgi:hypothetical protein